MNYYETPTSAFDSSDTDRATFIQRTYAHVAGALLAFAVIEYFLISSGIAATLAKTMLGAKYSWLVVMLLFMGASWIAEKWAASATSRGMQYAGLGLFVVAESIIFAPLLVLATRMDSMLLPKAAMITTGLFMGLTWIAFTTKKDFSFLGGILKIGCIVALGAIVASILFGFNLGIIFSCVMVLLMAAAVLYQTSNVIHHYHTSQYVSASLALFSSFATMLWYVIRILMSSSRN